MLALALIHTLFKIRPCYTSKKNPKMQNEIDQLTGIERYSVYFF